MKGRAMVVQESGQGPLAGARATANGAGGLQYRDIHSGKGERGRGSQAVRPGPDHDRGGHDSARPGSARPGSTAPGPPVAGAQTSWTGKSAIHGWLASMSLTAT